MPKKPQLSYNEHVELGKRIKQLKQDNWEVRDILQKAYGKTHETVGYTKEIDFAIDELLNTLDKIVHRLVPASDEEKSPHLCYFGKSPDIVSGD